MRRILGSLAAAACLACASSGPDLELWPESALAFGAGLEAAAADRPAAGETAGAAALLRGWGLCGRYSHEALAALARGPYERAGIEEQIRLLSVLDAEWSRAAITPGDPIPDPLAAATARAMRASRTAAEAFAAAQPALAALAEQFAAAHGEESRAAESAWRESEEALLRDEATLAAALTAAERDWRELEQDRLMVEAGAGAAPPDFPRRHAAASAALDEARLRLEAARGRLAAAREAAASWRARLARSGFAAREWAVAQREAARAVLDGSERPNFSLIEASLAELARERAAARR